VDANTTLRLVDEAALGRRYRREVGRLLAAEWGSAWRRDGHAGPQPPEFRVFALNGADHVVGHVSAFAIPTDPPLLLYGVGDLVVKQRYRGRGIARAICSALVEECWRRDADTVLVDTVDAQPVFEALGFVAPIGFAFWYERDGACVRHRHWLYAERRRSPGGPVQLLEHGDF
jgi:GNAT superfamily N-acetyltransferase